MKVFWGGKWRYFDTPEKASVFGEHLIGPLADRE